VRLIPNSWGAFREGLGSFFREFNACHDAKGQFCSRGASRLPAAPDGALRLRPGQQNLFSMADGQVRRFAFNVRTGDLITGVITDPERLFRVATHNVLIQQFMGGYPDYDEWVRGYIFASDRGDHVEIDPFYASDPAVFFEAIHATAQALADSGARTQTQISVGNNNTSKPLPGTIGAFVQPVKVPRRTRQKVAA
jgi:hypothetical protein